MTYAQDNTIGYLLREREGVNTQRERIEAAMVRTGWICGSHFLRNYMPTYSQRIGEMVAIGLPIERGICSNPGHKHKAPVAQYRWLMDEDEDTP